MPSCPFSSDSGGAKETSGCPFSGSSVRENTSANGGASSCPASSRAESSNTAHSPLPPIRPALKVLVMVIAVVGPSSALLAVSSDRATSSQRWALLSTFIGPLASELIRRPFDPTLANALCWCHYPTLAALGYHISGDLVKVDPFVRSDEGILPTVQNVCFLFICMGWCLRLSAVHVLGPAFNLRFGSSGAKARGGVVAEAFPYSFIRHPGIGSFLWTLPPALVMASGSILYGVLFFFLLFRAYTPLCRKEEQELAREMPGYSKYCARVRYTYVPGLY